jgi:ribonuclease E
MDRGDEDRVERAPARSRTRTRTRTIVDDDEPDADEPDGNRIDADEDGASDGGSGGAAGARKRRRRGGRGRSGGAKRETDGDERDADEDDEDAPRKTPAKRSSAKAKSTSGAKSGAKKPAARKSRAKKKDDEPASTRLRAKKSRREDQAPSRRRRVSLPPVKRVRNKIMVITEHGERDQIAVLEDRNLVEHYITRVGAHSMVGNIYKAKVQNVLPGMEAAFLDIGRGRNAVLYAGEVNYDEDIGGSTPRIEQVLKPGKAVTVQVTKDPMGGKGARLTALVSLPGRFLVLAPNSDVFGISRRLPDAERKRLRAAIKLIKPESHGVIVRTAAEGATEDELDHDISRLVQEWNAIEKKSKKAKAPDVLYEEPELTVRVVRDLFNREEFTELVTDSKSIYERITAYLGDIAPDLLDLVHLHEGALPVFEEYHVVEQIHKALDRKVWLPSGGYLIIDRTEALTVIDVNTGKSVGKSNLEDTVVGTNIEAALEVSRQLRLRDIGGMIIIDFIDMLLQQNKKKVVDTMREAMAQDKTRSQVFDISPLGLLEVTRKRVSAGLLESFSETCPTCEGRGILLTIDD